MSIFRIAGLIVVLTLGGIVGSRAGADSFTPTMAVHLVTTPDGTIVAGTTNLPDGAEVQYTIAPPDEKPIGGGILTIKDGRISTVPLLVDGRALQPGEYEFAAGCSDSDVQPTHVKRLFGKDGKNLDGPLVQPFGKALRIVYKAKLTLN